MAEKITLNQHFAVKNIVVSMFAVLYGSYAFAAPYEQGKTETATVDNGEAVFKHDMVNHQLADIRYDDLQESQKSIAAQKVVGELNRSGNPVRVIWYGNPNDNDGKVAQTGAKNDGVISGKVTAKGSDSYNKDDYRSSISIEGQGNAIDALGWTSRNNYNNVQFELQKIENNRTATGSAELQAGLGSVHATVSSFGTGNGISIVGTADFGKQLAIDGGVSGVSGASGKAATSASTSSSSLANTTSQYVSPDDLRNPNGKVAKVPNSLLSKTDMYGKNIDVVIKEINNTDKLAGQINALGNQEIGSPKIDEYYPQFYGASSLASGNGISVTTYIDTPDRYTYSEDRINHAKIGLLNNSGILSGKATVKGGRNTTHTQTYARGSGNGVSVYAATGRYAKNSTEGNIGNIKNTGEITGHLTQISGDNSGYNGLHVYSTAETYGSGNGISNLTEVQNAQTRKVASHIGNIDNTGTIRGSALIQSGSGTGDLSLKVLSSGNAVVTALTSRGADGKEGDVSIGNIKNIGKMTGEIQTQAGISLGSAKKGESIPKEEVRLSILDNKSYQKSKQKWVIPSRPAQAVDKNTLPTDAIKSNETATSEVFASGNGIVSWHNGSKSGKIGKIDNEGVISGHAKLYHGFTAKGGYQRIGFRNVGAGITTDGRLDSDINNAGIISGNHAALLAKGKINTRYSVNEPKFESGYTGDIHNYGIMSGAMIAGNYSGNYQGTFGEQDYPYFIADTDPIKNAGLYVYLTPNINGLPISFYSSKDAEDLRNDFMNPEKSKKLSKRANDMSGIMRAKEKGTLKTTYKTFAAQDIEKIEKIYGGKSDLSADDRIDLYLDIYNALTDKKTADDISMGFDNQWLADSSKQYATKEAQKELFALKSKLTNRRNDLKEKINKLGKDKVGQGFKNMVDMYDEFYKTQIQILHKKLNQVNAKLEEYGVGKQPRYDESIAPALVHTVQQDSIRKIEIGTASTQATINGKNYDIINAPLTNSQKDSEYVAKDSNISHKIINGVGIDNGALIANQDLNIDSSIINGYRTALNVKDNAKVNVTDTILNANGFHVNGTLKPYAILGSTEQNELTLTGNSIINGDIDMQDGDDKITIKDTQVKINGMIDMGVGTDTLTFGNSTVVNNPEPIKVAYGINNAENIIINQPTKIYADAKVKGTDKITLNDRLIYQVTPLTADHNNLQHALFDQNRTKDLTLDGTGSLILDVTKAEQVVDFGGYNLVDNTQINYTTTNNPSPTLRSSSILQQVCLINGDLHVTTVKANGQKSCSSPNSTTSPSNTTPSNTAPSNTVPSNTAPSNTAPSNTAPSNTAPSNTAPSNTAPSNTAPSNTVPSKDENLSIDVNNAVFSTPYVAAYDSLIASWKKTGENILQKSASILDKTDKQASGAINHYLNKTVSQNIYGSIAATSIQTLKSYRQDSLEQAGQLLDKGQVYANANVKTQQEHFKDTTVKATANTVALDFGYGMSKDMTMGLTLGKGKQTITDEENSELKGNSSYLGAYLSKGLLDKDKFIWTTGLGYGKLDLDGIRNISNGYDTHSFTTAAKPTITSIYTHGKYRVPLTDALTLEPKLGIAYNHVKIDGIKEQGMGALHIEDHSQNTTDMMVGTDVTTHQTIGNGKLFAKASFDYLHSMGQKDIKASFANGTLFDIETKNPNNSLRLGAQAGYELTNGVTVQADYTTEIGNDTWEAGIKFGYKF